jgi:GT2 family glycosyltransferase
MTTSPTLSVVVCSYNGANKLGDCLTALAKQRLRVDVLVIDDGSADDTNAVARKYDVTVISHERNKGIAAARNTGLNHANTSVVAFCDDDCTPPDDWTERMVAGWNANPNISVLGGLIGFDRPVSFVQRYLVYRNPFSPLEIELAHHPSVRYRLTRQFRPPRHSDIYSFPVYSVLGGNMSVDRGRALEVGGFDERLVFGEGEEVTLCEALRDRFGEQSVVIDPRVTLSHRFDASIQKTWRRSFAYGRGAAERWHKRGGLPSIPVVGPLALVSAAVLAPFSWPLGLSLGMLTLAAPLASWASLPNADLQVSAVAYPIVALVDDLAGALGFAQGVGEKARGKWNSR